MIAHQLESDDPDSGTIAGAHRYERHRVDKVFPLIENNRLFIAWRAQMPDTAILEQRPFEDPFAPFLLLEKRMSLSHNPFHINLQRHRGYG